MEIPVGTHTSTFMSRQGPEMNVVVFQYPVQGAPRDALPDDQPNTKVDIN